MEQIITNLFASVLSGGPEAVIALLAVIVIVLFLERKRLLAELKSKDEKIDKIINDYYNGNLTLSEALNSLKTVLYEIKGKIR